MTTSYLLPNKICDPIHGFIRFDEIEKRVIDSPCFQRLRYILQMGVSYLVYPGSTHSRFEHSLGVMELATRIYESLMAKHNLVFSEKIPTRPEERAYWRRILRIAALCHDMGHLPFSHTAESSIFPQGGHESMTLKIIQSSLMRGVWKLIPSLGRSVEEDIIKLSVSVDELKDFDSKIILSPWERVLSQIITDDNFGADRTDYLIRDAKYTGVSYGHFDYHQLIDTLRILPSPHHAKDLMIGVAESGMQSVESLWIARYLMSARVYQHPRARIYSHHMSRFMTNYYALKGFPTDLEGYLKQIDATILMAIYDFQNDYDAKVLLKNEKGFQKVIFESGIEENVISCLPQLENAFKDHLFVDYRPEVKQGERFRQFPVLTERGDVLNSSQVSDFLRDIPIGNKILALYSHPSKVEDIKKMICS